MGHRSSLTNGWLAAISIAVCKHTLWCLGRGIWFAGSSAEDATAPGRLGKRIANVSIVATTDTSPLFPTGMEMKVMTARDAKNRFGEFLDSALREPMVVTKNDLPVGIMISLEEAKDTLFADFPMEQEPDTATGFGGK